MELIKKFPTSAFVAGRLQKVSMLIEEGPKNENTKNTKEMTRQMNFRRGPR